MIKKRILGIDYGDFTIGLAIFDLETNFIYPYKTIFRSRASAIKKSVREIVGVIYEEGISDIVIGYPLNADGTEGERVEKVKEFAKKIENALSNAERERKLDSVNHDVNIPVIHFQDERLTTVEAEEVLKERGIKKADWKKNIDQISAEIILQDFKQVNKL